MGSTYSEPSRQPTNGRSGVYCLNSGEVNGWVLFDHSIWVEPIQQFVVGVLDSTIAELMERHFLPSNRLQFASDPLLFRWGDELFWLILGSELSCPGWKACSRSILRP